MFVSRLSPPLPLISYPHVPLSPPPFPLSSSPPPAAKSLPFDPAQPARTSFVPAHLGHIVRYGRASKTDGSVRFGAPPGGGGLAMM